jgi:hypothetical protein
MHDHEVLAAPVGEQCRRAELCIGVEANLPAATWRIHDDAVNIYVG